jgi:hypothetical protein
MKTGINIAGGKTRKILPHSIWFSVGDNVYLGAMFMKTSIIVKEFPCLFPLLACLILSSCNMGRDVGFGGYSYINPETSDTITFKGKDKVVFQWKSDSPFATWPFQLHYWVDDANNIFLNYMTSAEVFKFPYETLTLSDANRSIICTDRKGISVTYIRGEEGH